MPLTSARPVTENAPHLRRALGRWDLCSWLERALESVCKSKSRADGGTLPAH